MGQSGQYTLPFYFLCLGNVCFPWFPVTASTSTATSWRAVALGTFSKLLLLLILSLCVKLWQMRSVAQCGAKWAFHLTSSKSTGPLTSTLRNLFLGHQNPPLSLLSLTSLRFLSSSFVPIKMCGRFLLLPWSDKPRIWIWVIRAHMVTSPNIWEYRGRNIRDYLGIPRSNWE